MDKLRLILLIAAVVLFICTLCLFSQMDTAELENRLPGSTGKERIEILTELATNYSFIEPKKAIAFASEAQESMRKVPHPEYEARLLNAFSAAHLFQGEFTDAENYALRSVQTAQVSGNKKEYAEALYLIGLTNWRRGKYRRVLEPLNQSMELFKEIGHLRGTAKTCNVLGMFYWKTNEPTRALEYYLNAGKIYEEVGYKPGIAIISANSGLIHRKMGNFGKALAHYQNALETYRELDNKMGITAMLNNIAVVYEKEKKYNELNKSLSGDENGKKITEMQPRFDEKNNENQTKLPEKQQNPTGYLIIISFLVATVAVVLYRYLLKARANR